MDYILYSITSDLTDSVYYGYCQGEDESAVLESFLKGAKRAPDVNIRRGAVDWLELNRGQEDNIQVTVLDVSVDVLEVWCGRNDHRTSDPNSITGQSNWPTDILARVYQEKPERVFQWKINKILHHCSARKAGKMGVFTFQLFKQLGTKHGNDVVKADMDDLTASQFRDKYQITVNYPSDS